MLDQSLSMRISTARDAHASVAVGVHLSLGKRIPVRFNPTDGCALPKVEQEEMRTLPAEQLSAFPRQAKESGVYEPYYLDLATGPRRGELRGLKWCDVDLKKGVIHVHRQVARVNGKVKEVPLKTKNTYRSIAISKDAVEMLKGMEKQRRCEYVFPSPTGRPISPDSVRHMLHRVLKRTGLPELRFHGLRHPYVKR